MKIVIAFDIGADIIEVPQNIEDKLNKYQNSFLNWLSDESVNHDYWMYENGEKHGLCYRSDALVEWLNDFIFTEEIVKARVIEEGIYEWDDSLPVIYF